MGKQRLPVDEFEISITFTTNEINFRPFVRIEIENRRLLTRKLCKNHFKRSFLQTSH